MTATTLKASPRAQPPSDQVELPVLEALAGEPSLSQRQLAERAGLSLTRAHFVLKKLVDQGLVKVRNAAQSGHKLGYLYLLTPKGLEEKARLSYARMQRTAQAYHHLVGRLDGLLEPVLEPRPSADASGVPVVVVGDGPLADLVRSHLRARGGIDIVDDVAGAHVAVVAAQPVDGEGSGNGSELEQVPHLVELA